MSVADGSMGEGEPEEEDEQVDTLLGLGGHDSEASDDDVGGLGEWNFGRGGGGRSLPCGASVGASLPALVTVRVFVSR